MNARRTTPIAALLLGGLAALGAGCHARIQSQLTVNGAAFTPTACRSGQVYGFSGVELADATGARLRLAATPANEALAYWFPAGSNQGTELGTCGTVLVTAENSTINNVRNVQGNATVACANNGVTVAGTVTYANCH